jgi:hypothetical protein
MLIATHRAQFADVTSRGYEQMPVVIRIPIQHYYRRAVALDDAQPPIRI